MKNENEVTVSAHTLTPWVKANLLELPDEYYLEEMIVGADGNIVAVTVSGSVDNKPIIPREERLGNLETIIRAVNAHADLLAALIRTTTAAECLCSHIKSSGHDELDKVCEQARAAIAKARGAQ